MQFLINSFLRKIKRLVTWYKGAKKTSDFEHLFKKCPITYIFIAIRVVSTQTCLKRTENKRRVQMLIPCTDEM